MACSNDSLTPQLLEISSSVHRNLHDAPVLIYSKFSFICFFFFCEHFGICTLLAYKEKTYATLETRSAASTTAAPLKPPLTETYFLQHILNKFTTQHFRKQALKWMEVKDLKYTTLSPKILLKSIQTIQSHLCQSRMQNDNYNFHYKTKS